MAVAKKTPKLRKGAKLSDEQRAFVVRELACFLTPGETAAAVYEEFGVEITGQNAERYDHTKRAGKHAAKKWCILFDATREAFIEHFADRAPHAHKAVRIRKLSKAADAFEQTKNYLAMANMLERIAKEVGNVHTNRHEFTGKDGGPIRYADVGDMTDEQIYAELESYGIDPKLVHAAPKATQ